MADGDLAGPANVSQIIHGLVAAAGVIGAALVLLRDRFPLTLDCEVDDESVFIVVKSR